MTVKRIVDAVAAEFGLTEDEILGRVRTKRLVRARHAAMFLARRVLGSSYPELGRKFGGRDHTTILNAVRRVEQLLIDSVAFSFVVEKLERRLLDELRGTP